MAAPARMMFINFFISLLDLKCWELFEDGILDFVSFEPCRALANYILNRNIEDVHFRGSVGLISFHSVNYVIITFFPVRFSALVPSRHKAAGNQPANLIKKVKKTH